MSIAGLGEHMTAWTDSGSTFWLSSNRGSSWKSATVSGINLNIGAQSSSGIYQVAAQKREVGDGGGNFYVSADAGLTWRAVSRSAQT